MSVWLVCSISNSEFSVQQCEQSVLGLVLVVVVLISLWQLLQSWVNWLKAGLGGVPLWGPVALGGGPFCALLLLVLQVLQHPQFCPLS